MSKDIQVLKTKIVTPQAIESLPTSAGSKPLQDNKLDTVELTAKSDEQLKADYVKHQVWLQYINKSDKSKPIIPPKSRIELEKAHRTHIDLRKAFKAELVKAGWESEGDWFIENEVQKRMETMTDKDVAEIKKRMKADTFLAEGLLSPLPHGESSAEEKSAEEKSVEEKLVEAKSVEEKLAEEKSDEESSAEESSAEEKSDEESSAEEKSDEESSSEESLSEESLSETVSVSLSDGDHDGSCVKGKSDSKKSKKCAIKRNNRKKQRKQTTTVQHQYRQQLQSSSSSTDGIQSLPTQVSEISFHKEWELWYFGWQDSERGRRCYRCFPQKAKRDAERAQARILLESFGEGSRDPKHSVHNILYRGPGVHFNVLRSNEYWTCLRNIGQKTINIPVKDYPPHVARRLAFFGRVFCLQSGRDLSTPKEVEREFVLKYSKPLPEIGVDDLKGVTKDVLLKDEELYQEELHRQETLRCQNPNEMLVSAVPYVNWNPLNECWQYRPRNGKSKSFAAGAWAGIEKAKKRCEEHALQAAKEATTKDQGEPEQQQSDDDIQFEAEYKATLNKIFNNEE